MFLCTFNVRTMHYMDDSTDETVTTIVEANTKEECELTILYYYEESGDSMSDGETIISDIECVKMLRYTDAFGK